MSSTPGDDHRDKTLGVYITYYNERELLTELMESIAGQEDRPDEILIYDDCSPIPAVKFIPDGVQVRVIRGTQNRGACFARSCLLELASTDYVHFHDGDDLFLPQWCKRVRDVIRTRAPDLILTEISPRHNDSELSWHLGLESLRADDDLLRFCLRGAILTIGATYRRSVLNEIGGFSGFGGERQTEIDFALHLRLAARRPRYETIIDPLVIYRVREGSMSSDPIRVYTNGLEILKLLQVEIPPSYRSDLADAAIRMSRTLYQLGEKGGARTGFELALSFGKPKYLGQQLGYKFCARIIGPLHAEAISTRYRRLPRRIREVLNRLGRGSIGVL